MPVTEAQFGADILPFTLHYEGGFTLDRRDPGNWTGGKVGRGELKGTNFGIAASAHPTLDIRRLTMADAAAIYWRAYCLAPGFDRLDAPVLQATFDAGVMSGPKRAHDWQAASAALPAAKQVRAVSAARLALCRRNKNWPVYGKGWGARIAACEQRALKMLVPIVPQIPSSPPKAAPTPQPEGWIMKMLKVLGGAVVASLAMVGVSHAADIAVAPYANEAMTDVVAPLLGVVATWVVAVVGNGARKYLGQQAAAALAKNVNEALNWAIAAGVKAAEQKISEAGFEFKVDGIVADFAVGYAKAHFPGLMKQAGGEIADKVKARLASHTDLLELKATAAQIHAAVPKAA